MRDNKIQVLNLEDNKLGDKNVQKILKAILNSHNSLKCLNFSKNYLTNETSDLLKELINQSTDIEELYLHWVRHAITLEPIQRFRRPEVI